MGAIFGLVVCILQTPDCALAASDVAAKQVV